MLTAFWLAVRRPIVAHDSMLVHASWGLPLVLFVLLVAACLLRPPREAARWGAGAALAWSVGFAGLWLARGTIRLSVPWIPATGSNLAWSLDVLSAPLVVFVGACAFVVLLFSEPYMRHHLHERGVAETELRRFVLLMLTFMGAMTAVFLAYDLLLLFAALELTTLLSFLLIQFDRDTEARRSATVALVVTAGSSLVFLVGVVLVALETDSTAIGTLGPEFAKGSPVAAACLAFGVLAKSAQVPLHFWLPRAMVAPTPVSAYLHSAALVAAGLFVLLRVHPILVGAPVVLSALALVGAVSILVGGALALVSDELKSILAYSTIAQYGYAVVMVGLGGDAGLLGAITFIMAHGICKCALFLTAGVIQVQLGETRLSKLGGMAREAPLLATVSAVAALGLAGLPGTIGFFKDEMFFSASHRNGWLWTSISVFAVAMTLCYVARFWAGIFLGSSERSSPPERFLFVAPIGLLALATLGFGVFPASLHAVGSPAAKELHRAGLGREGTFDAELAYHFGSNPETWLALGALAAAVLLWSMRRFCHPLLRVVVDGVGRSLGPERIAQALARSVAGISDSMRSRELVDLRGRVAVVAIVMSGLVLGAVFLPHDTRLQGVDSLPLSSEPLALGAIGSLLLAAVSAVAASFVRDHLALVLVVSFSGFGVALAFAFLGAPDVSLVVVVIETIMTLILVAVLGRCRPEVLSRARDRSSGGLTSWGVGLGSGVVATIFVYAVLSNESGADRVPPWTRFAEQAHAEDVVTAILTDFRGLDTAVELTVFAVAMVGALSLPRGVKP